MWPLCGAYAGLRPSLLPRASTPRRDPPANRRDFVRIASLASTRWYRDPAMLDLLLIILIVGFFAAALLLVRGCSNITHRDPEDRA